MVKRKVLKRGPFSVLSFIWGKNLDEAKSLLFKKKIFISGYEIYRIREVIIDGDHQAMTLSCDPSRVNVETDGGFIVDIVSIG